MDIFKVFDNDGKTFDRYTVLTEPWYNGKSCDAFGFSDNCDEPMGFSQFCGDVYQDAELGKEISFDKLPQNVQEHILMKFNERIKK
jgi:hypothetical protein